MPISFLFEVIFHTYFFVFTYVHTFIHLFFKLIYVTTVWIYVTRLWENGTVVFSAQARKSQKTVKMGVVFERNSFKWEFFCLAFPAGRISSSCGSFKLRFSEAGMFYFLFKHYRRNRRSAPWTRSRRSEQIDNVFVIHTYVCLKYIYLRNMER